MRIPLYKTRNEPKDAQADSFGVREDRPFVK